MEQTPQTPSAPSSSMFSHTPARKPSILIVDADTDTRALYCDWLAGAGCDVVEAHDGRDALVKALMHPPSLVITEIRLPFIDGYGLCEILRRDRTTADVPILVVTAEARPAQITRARGAGADVVLVKPASSENVLTQMRGLVADAPHPSEPTTDDRREEAVNGPHRSKYQRALSRSHSRLTTTTPPASPPVLRCPSCDRLLIYERSEIGGVSHRHREQWDYYGCVPCGSFQHRQRTRKVRHVLVSFASQTKSELHNPSRPSPRARR